jgi:hypothetical protein
MRLREVTESTGHQVDREKGVITDVRILGATSRNNRVYTAEAISRAKPLYEGKPVFADHQRSGGERSIRDKVGWLEGVQEKNGGLNGNLHLFLSDPVSGKVLEAAEHRPDQLGLSHDVEGRAERRDGKIFVEEITAVNSVDIVSDPATTRSLFESLEHEEPMKKTIKQVCEAHKQNRKIAGLRKLLEQTDMAAVAEMPVEAPAEDPNAEIAAAFEKAGLSILKKIFSGEMDADEGLGKIKELLGQKEQASTEETPVEAPAAESVQQVKRLQAELGIRDLLEDAGVKRTAARVKALLPLTESERKELIADWATPAQQQREMREAWQKPASLPRQQFSESAAPKDAKEFAASIT